VAVGDFFDADRGLIMQTGHVATHGDYRDAQGKRREDWIPNSLISGFAATFAMTVVIFGAYWFARVVGDANGNQIERWLYALQNNSLTRSTQNSAIIAIGLNLVVGLIWALAYGYYGVVRLSGPAWLKGIIYALGPWLLSIVVFFPIMGAGIFGKDLGAGPLPVIGNLILHLAYGAVLGTVYAIDLESWLDGSDADLQHNRAAESWAAIGMLIGTPVGLILAWIAGPSLDQIARLPVIALLGAILGAALGLMVGSFAGLEHGAKQWTITHPEPR
jgi:hypothetical protein